MKYNYEGWTRIYLSCAETDTQKLIDILELMFGDGPEVDLEDLDTDTVQKMHVEAHKAKEAAAQGVGKESVSHKSLIIIKLPLAPEHGIDPDYWPGLVMVREWCNKKKEKVDKLYYQCQVCKHELQNRASMLTHTRMCLKIFLVCGICGKSYLSISSIEEHAEKIHDNQLNPKASGKGSGSAMQTK